MALIAIPVYLTAPTLPTGTCYPATVQELANLLFGSTQAQMESAIVPGFFTQGADVPAIDARDYPWLRTAGDNLDGWYTWDGASLGWVRPHRVPANGKEIIIWKDSESALWAYDGGDGEDPVAHPPTAATGAMWVRDTDFDFRFPIGIGTNATAYAGVQTTLALGATGGEEKHALTADENGAHTHEIKQWDGPVGGATGQAMLRVATTPAAVVPNYVSESSGLSTAHNTMPPYRSVIFAKRSARIYYRI